MSCHKVKKKNKKRNSLKRKALKNERSRRTLEIKENEINKRIGETIALPQKYFNVRKKYLKYFIYSGTIIVGGKNSNHTIRYEIHNDLVQYTRFLKEPNGIANIIYASNLDKSFKDAILCKNLLIEKYFRKYSA